MSSDPLARGAKRVLRIGKYEVLAHIATGGMGAVYKARDVELGREVALKVLPPDMAAKPVMRERFRREAQSAAQLRHENVVRIYEYGETAGTCYLVLEFVDGVDLHEYINRKGKLTPEEAVAILTQAARALDHAHRRGIVHRDIKPSNFLIATRDGKPVVKLTDLGLARQIREDEFRVTRDGTTVGTIDYMSPEQARDSGQADIRSDIYSLGCTFYHMLAGQAPFPEGSLTERMYKHIEAEPEDVRKYSPKVSAGLAAILRRMLRKKPSQRFQTPKELLEALANPDDYPPSSSGELGPAKEGGTAKGKTRKAKGKGSRSSQETAVRSSSKTKALGAARDWRLWAGAGVGLAAILGLVLWLAFSGGESEPEQAQVVRPGPAENTGPKPPRIIAPPPPPETAKPGPTNKNALKSLYKTKVALDLPQLRKEFQEPAFPAPAADAHRFRVRRGAGGEENTFASLEEACRDEKSGGKDTIIEIQDNGPLFVTSLTVTGHNLVLRAAKGYRPLLVWDVTRPRGAAAQAPSVFLSVTRGNLVLEGLDVVAWNDWREAAGEQPALVQVRGGGVSARDCTFAASGQHPLGLVALRILEGPAAGPRPVVGLNRCFVRGSNLTALVVQAPGADVWMDHCLLVGGDRPLLHVAGRGQTPTSLRVVRSTLVAGKSLLLFGPAGPADTQPAIHWSGWDSLLAQSNPLVDGDMLTVPPEASTGRMSWRAVNCLYAGWKRLLTGPQEVTRLSDWHKRWNQEEGDRTLPSTWPRDVPAVPEEHEPRQYRVAGTDAAFAATSGTGPLGCDVDALLAGWPGWVQTRKAWLWLVLPTQRFPTSPPELLEDDTAPDGEPLDLNKIDLGRRVEELSRNLQPGSKLVLRLKGKGLCYTSPIRVKGFQLVLFFDPPDKKDKKAVNNPPVLAPLQATAVNQDALIEVEDGGLDMINGRVRFASSSLAKLPSFMFQVRNGLLRLYRCRLEGPLAEAPDVYRGLVRVIGSGKTDPEKTPACVVNHSVLLSGRGLFLVQGTGARVSAARSILLAGEKALDLQPGKEARAPLTVQCFLLQNTIAVRKTLLHLGDAPQLAGLLEPMVVQADNNLILAPFTDTPGQACLLRLEGESLSRGLLLWQGTGNGYDVKHLQGYAVPDKEATVPDQNFSTWVRLWGTSGGVSPRKLDLPRLRTYQFRLDRPDVARLALPFALRPRTGQPPLGAPPDVLALGKK